MNIDLDREDLESLVKGRNPHYLSFEIPLVIKAGHCYSEQYGRTDWDRLVKLSESELYELYLICKDSWKHQEY